MDPTKRKILIPYDFSQLSDFAVKHAVQIAKITESSLVFLHIVHDLANESEALKRLEDVANNIANKYGLEVNCHIRPGKVSTAIKTYAETIDAFLVVMKTQEPKGRIKNSLLRGTGTSQTSCSSKGCFSNRFQEGKQGKTGMDKFPV